MYLADSVFIVTHLKILVTVVLADKCHTPLGSKLDGNEILMELTAVGEQLVIVKC